MARPLIPASWLLLLLAALRVTTAECYYRDGTSASVDFVQCPGVSFCCQDVAYCESNGLCRDKNNKANGSLTYFPNLADPGPYNYTGLYSTPACNNSAFNGCDLECTAATAPKVEYVWACGSDLESYCCHDDGVALGNADCCSNATRFQLDFPVAVLSATSVPTTSNPPLSTTTSATTSSAGASSTVTAASSPSSTTAAHSGLPEAAKIGIGVAIPVFVLFVAALLALFWRTHRLQHRLAQQQQGGPYNGGSSGGERIDILPMKGEAAGTRNTQQWSKAELDDSQRAPPAELQGLMTPVEAPANGVYEREKQTPSVAPVELG